MADTCDLCGYKNSEVKSGGGISDKGQVFTLQVEEPEDLQRDVLKSETASIAVPELELEVTTGTLGGLITTVEGLLTRYILQSLAVYPAKPRFSKRRRKESCSVLGVNVQAASLDHSTATG